MSRHSPTPELDAIVLDTHTTAAHPEAARELRAVKRLARCAWDLSVLIESALSKQEQVCGSEVRLMLASKALSRLALLAPSRRAGRGRQ